MTEPTIKGVLMECPYKQCEQVFSAIEAGHNKDKTVCPRCRMPVTFVMEWQRAAKTTF